MNRKGYKEDTRFTMFLFFANFVPTLCLRG